MNLAHLYYFKALAETKNRRQTAQSLSITQPTLSQAISKLEAELGVALFRRVDLVFTSRKKGPLFISTSQPH